MAPRGRTLRPTADKVRKALFDILGARVPGSRFLDAFAGTGAVGVEALSRGASQVVFLERDPAALDLVEKNLRSGNWTGLSRVLEGDVAASLRRLTDERSDFDVVFLDPPYEAHGTQGILDAVTGLLSADGVAILEHRASEAVTGLGRELRLRRTYRYGDTALTLWERGGPSIERPA